MKTACRLENVFLEGFDVDFDGFVFNLFLDNNRLTGSIPSELGMMSSLNKLELGKWCHSNFNENCMPFEKYFS